MPGSLLGKVPLASPPKYSFPRLGASWATLQGKRPPRPAPPPMIKNCATKFVVLHCGQKRSLHAKKVKFLLQKLAIQTLRAFQWGSMSLPQYFFNEIHETKMVNLHFAHKEACMQKIRSPAQELAILAFRGN